MKTTIETRNGKPVTVIREPFAEREAWVREQLAMGMPVVVGDFDGFQAALAGNTISDGEVIYFVCDCDVRKGEQIAHVITVLPALRYRGANSNIYQYNAAGLFPWLVDGDVQGKIMFFNASTLLKYCVENTLAEPDASGNVWAFGWASAAGTVTHAVDAEGNRHEIAIEGGE